ncbi:hypothetical protein PISMIDRAFT_681197 [Pisolithus microcarpus 441]|uniref:Uncharacterized protein n=1 Tax=Pisolithus microcarpus 441 TaxID=765257 RepID=A0A0C9YA17_9AGAM|nr:hypothetical protein PISMIDRAFT_681197 [Pisolithus microcarpus 441]
MLHNVRYTVSQVLYDALHAKIERRQVTSWSVEEDDTHFKWRRSINSTGDFLACERLFRDRARSFCFRCPDFDQNSSWAVGVQHYVEVTVHTYGLQLM